jgi:hypothetical protein
LASFTWRCVVGRGVAREGDQGQSRPGPRASERPGKTYRRRVASIRLGSHLPGETAGSIRLSPVQPGSADSLQFKFKFKSLHSVFIVLIIGVFVVGSIIIEVGKGG